MISNTIGMPSTGTAFKSSKAMKWTGTVLWVLCVPFLFMDTAIHLANPKFVVEANVKLGFSAGIAPVLGVIELIALALYLFPRTSVIGVGLLTGYLGGAVATHLHSGGSYLFALLIGILLWGSLYFRNERVRSLFA